MGKRKTAKKVIVLLNDHAVSLFLFATESSRHHVRSLWRGPKKAWQQLSSDALFKCVMCHAKDVSSILHCFLFRITADA
jgi:hypothetical protein